MGLLVSGPHGGCKLVSDITSENEPNSLGPTTHAQQPAGTQKSVPGLSYYAVFRGQQLP